jgi:hypothetical protein
MKRYIFSLVLEEFDGGMGLCGRWDGNLSNRKRAKIAVTKNVLF